LHLVIEAQELLMNEGIRVRVVSMPSWELFEKQSKAYKESVLPPSVEMRLAVEAGVTLGWYKYVTAQGDVIGIDHFGESGPGNEVMNHFGFTTENVYQRARALLKKQEMMKAMIAADNVIVE
jgi:transketolase